MSSEFRLIKGVWRSDEEIKFCLPKPVEDVTEICREFRDFIKGRLPFNVRSVYIFYSKRRAEISNLNPYWDRGFVVIDIGGRSFKSRFNPWHDKLRGRETIVIEFCKGCYRLCCYNEWTGSYYYGYAWHFSIDTIKKFMILLQKFVDRDKPEKVEFT